MNDANLDLVYILKPSDNNPELRYSLRSIEKYCKFRRVWFVGYQPKWTQNVGFVPTEQRFNKWKNSTLNVLTACQCQDTSSNFVLMNDDFFAVRAVSSWEDVCNVCRGSVDEAITLYEGERRPSEWMRAFKDTKSILALLRCNTAYNFEVHMPMIISKQFFLEFIEHPLVKWFASTEGVLQKRTLYQNLYRVTHIMPPPRVITDVKLKKGEDLTPTRLCDGWLSVFDGVVRNSNEFPRINEYLKQQFPDKSRFEV